jgi:nicotinamidase-related amidase
LYEVNRTAFLVVDPYNDFMTPGGKMYETTKESADSVGFYEHMRRLLPAVRAAGIQIVVVPHLRWRKGQFDNWNHINTIQTQGRDTQAFEDGAWGGDWNEEFGPKAGDIVVNEHWAQNGFANTDLHLQLKERDIDRIVLVGFIANSCVEATGRYGMELGYHVTLISDAIGAFDMEGMEAARINGPMFAHAIHTTDEWIALLPQSGDGAHNDI